MRFEYNTDLSFSDRVNLVAKEILDEYPLISKESAITSASFASPVCDKATNDDKFDRYYFIMKEIGRDSDEFPHVFNDAFKLYQQGLNRDIYKNAIEYIIDYAVGNSDYFPELYNC